MKNGDHKAMVSLNAEILKDVAVQADSVNLKVPTVR